MGNKNDPRAKQQSTLAFKSPGAPEAEKRARKATKRTISGKAKDSDPDSDVEMIDDPEDGIQSRKSALNKRDSSHRPALTEDKQGTILKNPHTTVQFPSPQI